jgi:hypothetical protein
VMSGVAGMGCKHGYEDDLAAIGIGRAGIVGGRNRLGWEHPGTLPVGVSADYNRPETTH